MADLSHWTATWIDAEVGTVFADEEVGPGLRLQLRRGYAAICGYFLVRADHPLVKLFPRYTLPIHVHGGITYGEQQVDGSYAWGWDYGHCDDQMVFPPEVRAVLAGGGFGFNRGQQWHPALVWYDAQDAIPAMLRLMREAEQVAGQLDRETRYEPF